MLPLQLLAPFLSCLFRSHSGPTSGSGKSSSDSIKGGISSGVGQRGLRVAGDELHIPESWRRCKKMPPRKNKTQSEGEKTCSHFLQRHQTQTCGWRCVHQHPQSSQSLASLSCLPHSPAAPVMNPRKLCSSQSKPVQHTKLSGAGICTAAVNRIKGTAAGAPHSDAPKGTGYLG